MILTKLTLNDFGLFGGDHVFDLRPMGDDSGVRPIILFGGKNGSGKTTILEALRLCLYGQQTLGLRTTTAEYHDYLTRRLHQSRQRTADRGCVALEFEHGFQGKLSVFMLERSWHRTNNGIAERFVLRKDGVTGFGLGPEFRQQLLKELIPIGLADLFFFDGERIQGLADDELGSVSLGAALNELLGLNLIEQLEADLRVYLSRLGGLDTGATLAEDADRLEQRQLDLEQVKAEREQDRASITVRIDQLRNRIARKEAEIASRGGIFVDQRGAAEVKKQELLARIRQAEMRLVELCATLLPFSLAPTVTSALVRELQAEEQLNHLDATKAVLLEQAASLGIQMTDESFWQDSGAELMPIARAAIIARVQDLLYAQAKRATRPESGQTVHGLSTQESRQLQSWIEQADGPVRNEAVVITLALVDAKSDLDQAQALLDSVPPSELIGPLLRELRELNEQDSKLGIELSRALEHESKCASELDTLNRSITRLNAELENRGSQVERGAFASLVLELLPTYRTEQLRRKLGDLEAAFTDYFNRLARKSEFVSHVIINQSDFTMTLVSNEGRYIPKSQLSSGEKQIYAIALLWALRAVAGRPLPVVIDTPLGRLDSNHRQNLVERYFPNASHQVILLSTDTEIDADYFKQLEPDLSHAYHLVFDDETGTTNAEPGYFWHASTEVAEVAHAT
jgi:DNA sulfur modification protein DndD